MPHHSELIQRVEHIYRHPAEDTHGHKIQLKMLAEAVIDAEKRHHRLEEVVSALVGKLNELRHAPSV